MNDSELIPSKDTLVKAHKVMKGVGVPTIPEVVMAIDKELKKSAVDLSKIGDLVSSDTAISGMVLKTINSPLFSLRREVESIHQAVLMLGADKINSLVITSALRHAFNDSNPVLEGIWDETNVLAFCTKKVVESLSLDISSDEAYMAALFINTGKLLLAKKYPDYGELIDIGRRHPSRVLDEEASRYGSNHAIIGYLLGIHWGLPERVYLAILLRGNPAYEKIDDMGLKLLLASLLTSEAIVTSIIYVSSLEDTNYPVTLFQAMDTIQMDSDILGRVTEEVDDFIADNSMVFHQS